jgi:hypothetical protein
LKLIVQPADGAAPLLKAIQRAKKSIEIVIFRFDQTEIEHALEACFIRPTFAILTLCIRYNSAIVYWLLAFSNQQLMRLYSECIVIGH